MDHKCSPLHFILPELSDCPLTPNYSQIHVLHAYSCIVSRAPRYCALIGYETLLGEKNVVNVKGRRNVGLVGPESRI